VLHDEVFDISDLPVGGLDAVSAQLSHTPEVGINGLVVDAALPNRRLLGDADIRSFSRNQSRRTEPQRLSPVHRPPEMLRKIEFLAPGWELVLTDWRAVLNLFFGQVHPKGTRCAVWWM